MNEVVQHAGVDVLVCLYVRVLRDGRLDRLADAVHGVHLGQRAGQPRQAVTQRRPTAGRPALRRSSDLSQVNNNNEILLQTQYMVNIIDKLQVKIKILLISYTVAKSNASAVQTLYTHHHIQY